MAAFNPPFPTGSYVPMLVASPFNSIAVQICDAQNEACAQIFRMPKDDTLTHVFVVSGAKNATPTDDTWTVSLQGVTNGVPDNTPLGGGSPASATFPNATYPVANWGTNTGFWIQLANSIAVQGGDLVAVVVQKTGATDGTNFLRFNFGTVVAGRFPYTLTADSAGTWTKQTGNYPAFMAVKSATAIYGMPGESLTSNTFGNTTETGFSFTLPSDFGTGNTYGLRRVRLISAGTAPAAAGTMVASLYGGTLGSAAALQRTTTIDSDDFAANSTNQIYEFTFPEDTLAALVPGTKYGVGFAHSAGSGASIRSIQIDNANDAAGYTWGGLARITRTLTDYPPSGNDTNTFSETTTEMIVAEMDFQVFTASSGSGGGSTRVYGS